MSRQTSGLYILFVVLFTSISGTVLAGIPNAYRADYDEGYTFGFTLGYDSGFTSGQERGIASGTADGTEDGFADGWDVSYWPNYEVAYNTFYPAGHFDGWDQGTIDGFIEGYNYAPVVAAAIMNSAVTVNGAPVCCSGSSSGIYASGTNLTASNWYGSGAINLIDISHHAPVEIDWATHFYDVPERATRVPATSPYSLPKQRPNKVFSVRRTLRPIGARIDNKRLGLCWVIMAAGC